MCNPSPTPPTLKIKPRPNTFFSPPSTHGNHSQCSEEDVCHCAPSCKCESLQFANHTSRCAVQMPQLSAAELRQAENDAYSVVNQGVVAAVSLYLCTFDFLVLPCRKSQRKAASRESTYVASLAYKKPPLIPIVLSQPRSSLTPSGGCSEPWNTFAPNFMGTRPARSRGASLPAF